MSLSEVKIWTAFGEVIHRTELLGRGIMHRPPSFENWHHQTVSYCLSRAIIEGLAEEKTRDCWSSLPYIVEICSQDSFFIANSLLWPKSWIVCHCLIGRTLCNQCLLISYHLFVVSVVGQTNDIAKLLWEQILYENLTEDTLGRAE